MTDVLIGPHAEYVGGAVVEPGEEIPESANPDIVKRLRKDGRLAALPKASPTKKGDD
jgi:hypothetical protein